MICLQTDGQTDGHGDTSIPPLQLRCGGITNGIKLIYQKRRFQHVSGIDLCLRLADILIGFSEGKISRNYPHNIPTYTK